MMRRIEREWYGVEDVKREGRIEGRGRMSLRERMNRRGIGC